MSSSKHKILERNDKPSTISDIDTMNCNHEQKNSIEMKLLNHDTMVIDKFQACFIDCKCQCEVT